MKPEDIERLSSYDGTRLSDAIDRWVILRRNSDRNRLILKRALIDGAPFERISEEFGLTSKQVSHIVCSELDILYKHL